MGKANTLIQQAADFIRSIGEDSRLQAELRGKQEQRWRDLQVLRRYQAYRRGAGSIRDCPSPRAVSVALERAIRELKSHFLE